MRQAQCRLQSLRMWYICGRQFAEGHAQSGLSRISLQNSASKIVRTVKEDRIDLINVHFRFEYVCRPGESSLIVGSECVSISGWNESQMTW